MSTSDVLIRVRLLLAERLANPTPTRGDNQKLSAAIWDLHNVSPNNAELFNLWQALSSTKRDPVRFEAGVQRLAAYLQSSSITGVSPALRTAATFYNQSVSNDRSGTRDAVIGPPPTPAPVAPIQSARPVENRPSAITVERFSQGVSTLWLQTR